ncbi:MAG TPA: hypothetical protein VKB77_04335 [Terriglobales bacterium]|nr:hypothetical protein [Terriglobales bacterium]
MFASPARRGTATWDPGRLGLAQSITLPREQMQTPWVVLAAVLATLVILVIDSGVARAGWQQLQQ